MIRSYKCRKTEALAGGVRVAGFRAFEKSARRKLRMLEAADVLQDLRAPPGNCLERLKGKRKAEHSIRINNQWRLCFKWIDGGAEDVKIEDYH